MAELIIHSGKLQGKRLALPEREFIVGRDESCQMRLTSSLVSRQHCRLRVTPEGIWVEDLQSQNGTYVNDVALTEPLLLKPGDILRIGAALFQVPEAPVRIGSSPAPKGKGKISDDEIADWLSDDDLPLAGKSSTDTAVISVGPSPSKGDSTIVTTAAATATPAAPRVPTPTKQPPKTVKEEAADIIRRHWEAVRARQGK